MKRIVLDHKTILAHNLTYEEATDLMGAIRARKDLEPLFTDRDLWMSNSKPRHEGDLNIWYVYSVDKDLRAAFLKNPEHFVFEVGE